MTVTCLADNLGSDLVIPPSFTSFVEFIRLLVRVYKFRSIFFFQMDNQNIYLWFRIKMMMMMIIEGKFNILTLQGAEHTSFMESLGVE